MNQKYQYKTATYYTITYLITATLWLIGAYIGNKGNGNGEDFIFMLFGLLAPFIVSTVMTFSSKNKPMKKEFFNRLINIKLIQPKMLPVMFLIMPFAVLVSIAISTLFGGSMTQFQFADGFSFTLGSVPTLVLLLLAATFEELGWRGYAFDSLHSRSTFFKASILFGILWSAWHLPLVFVHDSYQYEIVQQNIWYGVNFFVGIIPMGIIISWMCVKNNKSILAAMLFHFIVNMSQELLSMTQATKCIETAVLFVIAAALIAYEKELFFSKKHIVANAQHSETEITPKAASVQI